jgi:hypothetical protein
MRNAQDFLKYLRAQLYVTYRCLTDPVILPIIWSWLKACLRKIARAQPSIVCKIGKPQTSTPATAPVTAIADFPVDIVYTWVNGTDPEYIKIRAYWSEKLGQEKRLSMDKVRFLDNSELKLSLRSVERFLPWVRTIYIVTNNQTPKWLDTSHPKIRMVSIDDIFPDKNWTPSFNSHAIEFQLHHIPGLSENFIYCCDDTLFGNPCSKQDFFTFLGKEDETQSKTHLQFDTYLFIYPAYIEYLRNRKQAMLWRSAWNNLKYVLERSFPGHRIRSHISHQAVAMKKSALSYAAKQYPKIYQQVSATRFRSMLDVPPIGFACHLALLRKQAQVTEIDSQYFGNMADFRAYLASQTPAKLLCINSFLDDTDICEAIADLPFCNTPSSFEKQNTVG